MLKDIKTSKKRLHKALKKFNNIAEEELNDLDRTFLEFYMPRLKEFYKKAVNISKDEEWLSSINSLISVGDIILNNKREGKPIEILNSKAVVTKNKISIDQITEEEVMQVLNLANAEYTNRETFKKLLMKVIFTLNI